MGKDPAIDGLRRAEEHANGTDETASSRSASIESIPAARPAEDQALKAFAEDSGERRIVDA